MQKGEACLRAGQLDKAREYMSLARQVVLDEEVPPEPLRSDTAPPDPVAVWASVKAREQAIQKAELNPKVIASIRGLGRVFLAKGDGLSAVQEFDGALRLEEKRLGSSKHPALIPGILEAASAHRKVHQSSLAAQLYERAMEIAQSVATQPSPVGQASTRPAHDLAFVEVPLAEVYFEMGQLEKVMPLMIDALGSDHPDVQQMRSKLADAYLLRGDEQSARDLLVQLGDDGQARLIPLCSRLMNAAVQNKNVAVAEETAKHMLVALDKTKTQGLKGKAWVFNRLLDVYLATDQIAKLEGPAREVLSLHEKQVDIAPRSATDLHHLLARSAFVQKKYGDVLKFGVVAIKEIGERDYPDKDDALVWLYQAVGIACAKEGKADETVGHYLHAVEIEERRHGKESPEVLAILQRCAMTLKEGGRREASVDGRIAAIQEKLRQQESLRAAILWMNQQEAINRQFETQLRARAEVEANRAAQQAVRQYQQDTANYLGAIGAGN